MTDDKRAKRQAAKERARQEKEKARKRASRAELFRRLRVSVLLGLSVMVVLVLTNLRSDEGGLPPSYERLRARPTACDAEQPPPERTATFDAIPDQGLEGMVTATITTSCGEVIIEVDPSMAPQTADAFVFLAREGIYDGTVVSEVNPGLTLLAGDPDPTGPDAVFRSGVPNEYPSEGFQFDRGTVALAGDSASRSSGFLIVLGDDVPLNLRLNVFGKVVAGDDVIDRITGLERTALPGSAARTVPAETVYIESITIDG